MKKSSQATIPPEWLAEYDTGIYRDPPKKLVPISSSRLGAESKRLYDLDRQLTEAEKFARNVLALPEVKNRVFHNWRRRELYARRVLAHVQLVRQWLTESDAEKVGVNGYWLGRSVEALRVCSIEHNADRGRTTLRGAREGGQKRATDPQTLAAWRARAVELRSQTPGISDLSAAEIIFREQSGAVETIRKKIRR